MSANTKIVVLRRKELLYTGIFAALGVLFLVLLLMLLLPGKDNDTSEAGESDNATESEFPMPDNVADPDRRSSLEDTSAGAVADTGITNTYIPGIYTTELVLGSETVGIEVIVNDHAITSLSLVDPEDTLTTMYPLLQPTMDSLSEQICETQDLDRVTYSSETRYTSLVLLEAIRTSLEKAKPTATPETSAAPATSPEASTAPAKPAKIPTTDIRPAA